MHIHAQSTHQGTGVQSLTLPSRLELQTCLSFGVLFFSFSLYESKCSPVEVLCIPFSSFVTVVELEKKNQQVGNQKYEMMHRAFGQKQYFDLTFSRPSRSCKLS